MKREKESGRKWIWVECKMEPSVERGLRWTESDGETDRERREKEKVEKVEKVKREKRLRDGVKVGEM